MKTLPVAVLLALSAASGCGEAPRHRPLPTVDSDGTLDIPADYAPPRPGVDPARVDCKAYLEMNPAEIRNMAGELCMQSKSEQERARNPYCEIQKISEACLAPNVEKASS